MWAARTALPAILSRCFRLTPLTSRPLPVAPRSSTESHLRVEVLNDLDSELFNFLRVLQSHHEELIRYLRFCIVSRNWYALFFADGHQPAHGRAARCTILLPTKNSFGGLIIKRCFHYGIVQRPNFNPDRFRAIGRSRRAPQASST